MPHDVRASPLFLHNRQARFWGPHGSRWLGFTWQDSNCHENWVYIPDDYCRRYLSREPPWNRQPFTRRGEKAWLTVNLELRWRGVISIFAFHNWSRISGLLRLNHFYNSAEPPPGRPFIMFSLLLLLSLAGPHLVNGQIAQTNATCSSDYSWMGNSKGSSPCQVAAQLDAQCNDGCMFFFSIFKCIFHWLTFRSLVYSGNHCCW